MNPILENFFSFRYTKKQAQSIADYLTHERLTFSDRSGNGPIGKLERLFAEFSQINLIIAMNSGTSAINTAYFAIDLQGQDEVIVPQYCYGPTIAAIKRFGAIPVSVPVSKEDLSVGLENVERGITSKTKAILISYMTGNSFNIEGICELARERGIFVIEDCSRSYGAKYNGNLVGSFSDISCFSMQDSKSLSSIEGGLFATNNQKLYERAIFFSQPGRVNKEVTDPVLKGIGEAGLGEKFRINSLGAIIALDNIKNLSLFIEQSRKNNARFTDLLNTVSQLIPLSTDELSKRGGWRDSYAFFNGTQEDAIVYVKKLNQEGIPSRIEFGDNWFNHFALGSKNFNSLPSVIVFPLIAAYHDDNSEVLEIYKRVFEKIN